MLKKDDVLKERYTITRPLGQGGTAKTYLAIDTTTKKEVVLKAVNLGDIDDWKIINLFEREIKVLKILDHPFIPDYIDNFREEMKGQSLYVLVQEYVDGDNLESLVKNGKRFSFDEIINILKCLLKILTYIHNLQPPVIHRDINPKNIIINKGGCIYLVDFGAVGSIINDTIEASRSDTFVGTVGYLAHEQLFGKALPATDLYGLGMTIIYLLTGIEPFKMELEGMSINLDAYPVIPDNLKTLLRKIIEPDYKKRLPHAQEALDFLEGKKQLPDSQSANVPGNRIKIKELDSKERLIILPIDLSFSFCLLLGGGIFTVVSIFLFILFYLITINAKYVFFVLGVIFGVIGIFVLFIGLMSFIKKRYIHLKEEKISVVKIRAGFIKTVEEFLLTEYKGLKIEQIGKIDRTKSIYSVLISGNKKDLSPGMYYTKDEINFIEQSIANHIKEHVIF